MEYQKPILRLSAAQLGIWFAQTLDPDNPGYKVAEFIEIHGAVDPSLLTAAIRQAVVDTEAFRVRLIETIDGPQQIIESPSEISIPLLDVSSESDPHTAAQAWMKTDLTQPVDILRGPLRTFALFKTAADRFLWYNWAHHIIMDGFGGSLFTRRIAEVYTALADGLPCPENPFGSLTLLEEDDAAYRASEHFARDRQFWLERLADRPEPLSLSSRPRAKPIHNLRETGYLQPAITDKLRATGRIAGVTLAPLLIGAVASYLHRLTGAQDLVLGLAVTGRIKAPSRRVPGMVANVLPLRLTVRPQMSLSELAQRVGQEIFRALRHQRYRLEDMRRDLGLSANDQSLFGTTINVMAFDYDLSFAGNQATAHNLALGQPVDDLIIAIYDRSGGYGLRVDFEANPALYSVDELARHLRRFLNLLEAIATDPADEIGRFELLTRDERGQVLVEWNDTLRELPLTTFPALFEAQVQRCPEASALVFEETILSYGELNLRANRLAHFLIRRGIGPETLVALAVPRSIDMVVGLLAVQKAGAAYLPLDPDYPAERLAFVFQDADPAYVITTTQIAQRLPDGIVHLLLDDPETARALTQLPDTGPSGADRTQPLTPDHPAYVIYTSGSTGTPKGIVITHASLLNFLLAMQEAFQLQARDRLLAVTTVGFDIAALELFLPLLAGARLIIAPKESVQDAPALAQLIKNMGTTILQATPTLWSALLATDPQELVGLRMLVGGEALPAGLARELRALGAQLTNLYGPTETTIW
jgi:nonribosomal peptide synthetase DhbF